MKPHSRQAMEKENTLPGDIAAARILFILSISVGVAIIGLGIIWPLIPVYALNMSAAFYTMGMLALVTAGGVILLIPRHPFVSDVKTKKAVAPIKDLLKQRVVLGLFFLRLFVASGRAAYTPSFLF